MGIPFGEQSVANAAAQAEKWPETVKTYASRKRGVVPKKPIDVSEYPLVRRLFF
jgi:hypothetical protein